MKRIFVFCAILLGVYSIAVDSTLVTKQKNGDRRPASSDKPVPVTQIEPENVVRRPSLATFLGLTSQDVLYHDPRSFREKELNDMKIDGTAGNERPPSTNDPH